MTDFDGQRLSTARRLRRMQRTALADEVGVSAAAITQYERGQARPTHAVLAQLALALGMPGDFFRLGQPIARVSPAAAHFRSLRSTPAISRDQALAFAEIGLAVFDVVERYVELPQSAIPLLPVGESPSDEEIATIAAEARQALGVSPGPVGHVVRLLEANGAAVLRLGRDVDARVSAFSTDAGHRPLILLSPAKDDRAKGRFDAAHELGHLIMHQDVEPGSRLIEVQAHRFAAEFLAPMGELEPDLPRRLDWEALLECKRTWGVSLAALAYRAHDAGIWSELVYRRANQHLRAAGYPEAGPLGPPESPYVLGAAVGLLAEAGTTVADLAEVSRLPLSAIELVIEAGREPQPRLVVQL